MSFEVWGRPESARMGRLQALWPSQNFEIPHMAGVTNQRLGAYHYLVNRSRKSPYVLVAVLTAGALCGCVRQSDYEDLQKENQQLQGRLDQANEQVRQAQLDLSVQQSRMSQLPELQDKLQKTQEQLRLTQDELDILKAEFDRFKSQRRSAMLGKTYPSIQLDDGKVLRDAQITAINGDELSIKHHDGALKVALAKSTDDLRWEACYNPQKAVFSARDRLLAEARALESRSTAEKRQPPQAGVSELKPSITAVEALRRQLASQRSQLNSEYHTLAAKNTAAMKGAVWDMSRPEASPLLNSVSGGRAILGISRLQSLRDAIFMTQRQLQDMDPSAR